MNTSSRSHLTGRLTRDPELVQLDERQASAACGSRSRTWAQRDRLRRRLHLRQARRSRRRVLSKGWLVAVDGRLDYRHWVADDGANRSAIGVIGNVEFLAAAPATAAPSRPSSTAAA